MDMNTKNKLAGSLIKKFTVTRKDGSQEVFEGPFKNVMSGNSLLSSAYDVPTTINFGLLSAKRRTLLNGVFSQSGTTITRVSGTGDLSTITNGDYLQFANGEFAFKVSHTSASSCTVSTSRSVSDQALHRINLSGWAVSGPFGSAVNFSASTVHSGANSLTTNANHAIFNVTSGGGVTGFHIAQDEIYQNRAFYYDLPVDIPVSIGDQITITAGDWEFSRDWNVFNPIELPTSPISGLTTSCKLIRRFERTVGPPYTPTHVYLIPDGSNVPLGTLDSGRGNVSALPVTKVSHQCTYSTVGGTYANNYKGTANFSFAISSTMSNCKQLAWGNVTSVYGILEFDTPQNLEAGRVISLAVTEQVIPTIPVP